MSQKKGVTLPVAGGDCDGWPVFTVFLVKQGFLFSLTEVYR